jgi:hypothetical protein
MLEGDGEVHSSEIGRSAVGGGGGEEENEKKLS